MWPIAAATSPAGSTPRPIPERRRGRSARRHVKDLEVGAKTEWTILGLRGQINADYFHTWYSNIQEGEIIPGTAQTVTRNLADARIDGVEIEGGIYPSNWFRLTGNVAYTDATYTNWLEHSTCGAQYWRPQCGGLPTTTAVTINHSGGSLTVNGQTITFKPDRFANTSKWQWAIQPALILKPWIGEDVTIAANVYHRGPYVDATAVANTSKIAGVPMTPEDDRVREHDHQPVRRAGLHAGRPAGRLARALGSRISMAAGVTNLGRQDLPRQLGQRVRDYRRRLQPRGRAAHVVCRRERSSSSRPEQPIAFSRKRRSPPMSRRGARNRVRSARDRHPRRFPILS